MNIEETLIVVGAGPAGAELSVAARQQGWPGAIVLIGDEPHLPYQRPPLSKTYFSGKADADSLAIRPVEAYAKAEVELRLHTRVSGLDLAARSVTLSDGNELAYTKLALCLGGRPREVAFANGADGKRLSNLHYLRTRADVDAIRAGVRAGAKLVIVGGGYIGLEAAASARQLGAEVTVLEAAPRVLARVTGPALSAFYERVHREAGVDVRTGVTVQGVELDEAGASVRAVLCADGSRIEADVVIVGIGIVPDTEFAACAGLEVDGGIVVDAHGQTSDPHVYAAGDCTVHPNAHYGRQLRLESVPHALEQARTVAAALGGKPKPYNTIPWFWSDQYDLKLQMVGLSAGYDEFVVRGSTDSRSFSAFYLCASRLVAADVVSRPQEFMVAKRLLAEGALLDARRLADESVPLKEMLAPKT